MRRFTSRNESAIWLFHLTLKNKFYTDERLERIFLSAFHFKTDLSWVNYPGQIELMRKSCQWYHRMLLKLYCYRDIPETDLAILD